MKMKKIEWIAMVWTIPVVMVGMAAIILWTFVSFVFRFAFVKTGTAGAMAYLMNEISIKIKNKQWSKIRKHDAELASLDSNTKP